MRARSVSVHQIMKAVDQPKCPEPNMTHSTVSVPTKKTSENKKATIKKTVEKTLKKRAKANSPPAFKSVLENIFRDESHNDEESSPLEQQIKALEMKRN